MARRKEGFPIIGMAAAACAACCAGPLVALLGGITILGVGAAIFVGAGALVVTVAVAATVVLARRSRLASCSPEPSEMPVALPTRITTGGK